MHFSAPAWKRALPCAWEVHSCFWGGEMLRTLMIRVQNLWGQPTPEHTSTLHKTGWWVPRSRKPQDKGTGMEYHRSGSGSMPGSAPFSRNVSIMAPEGQELTTICWSYLYPQWPNSKRPNPKKDSRGVHIYIAPRKADWWCMWRPLKMTKAWLSNFNENLSWENNTKAKKT